MVDSFATRRSVLKAAGIGALTTAGFSAHAAASGSWTSVASSTDVNLNDVVYTADGAYAVGGAGIVLERTTDGWQKIIDGGASGNGNDLFGADVTDDGERLWFVGASGEVGEYDISSGTLYNYSQPGDTGDNFNDVAVTGVEGEANVYAACDSGHVHYSFENGASQTWTEVTPGSGDTLSAIDFFDDKKGHVVDTNQKVFETNDGETWDAIGIADAGVNFYGVDSDGFDDVWVSGGSGTVLDWDGANWTSTTVGNPGLRDIEVTDDDSDGYTVGDSGAVFHYDGTDWTEDTTPTGETLTAVARGPTDIAVGASGTIIEN